MPRATPIHVVLDRPDFPTSSPSVLHNYANPLPVRLSFRDLILAPVSRADIELLHGWEADPASLRLWTTRKDILSQEEFAQLFASRLRSYYHVFFMIHISGRPVGFIYSYEPNFLDGHAYVTAFVETVCRDRGIAARAGLLFAHYLFSYFSFRKLYCDVFEYNSRSLTALKGAGLSVEGVFRDHRFYGGRHWTMYRLALYREDFYRRFTPMLQRMLGLPRPGHE
jgi:RimJ/RimL family protein N-acetyltransferase